MLGFVWVLPSCISRLLPALASSLHKENIFSMSEAGSVDTTSSGGAPQSEEKQRPERTEAAPSTDKSTDEALRSETKTAKRKDQKLRERLQRLERELRARSKGQEEPPTASGRGS